MPKSNKNKNRNMRKNRSLKRKINKNKSMRNKRKTNKKNMKGGSKGSRAAQKLMRNWERQGKNASVSNGTSPKPSRKPKVKHYHPQQTQKPWLIPREPQHNHQHYHQQHQHHQQHPPHQHHHQQLHQQPQRQSQKYRTSTGKIKPWLLNPSQKTHQRRRRTPKNSTRTQAEIMTDAMHRAYTYKAPAKIHPDVEQLLFRHTDHRRGPARSFINHTRRNQARERAQHALSELPNNAYA